MDDVLACRRPVLLISVRGITLACLVIACVACAGTARADSIGVHFGGVNNGPDDNSYLADGDSAGYAAQRFWNNTTPVDSTPDPSALPYFTGSQSLLLDSQGQMTNARIDYSSGGVGFATGETTNTTDAQLMHSYLDAAANVAVVTLANIPYATYDLYIYVGWNVPNLPTPGSSHFDDPFPANLSSFNTLGAPFSDTGFFSTPAGDFFNPPANVVVYSGLSGSTFTYNQTGVGLNGIQIVDTSQIAAPVPSPALLGAPMLAGLAVIHFRNRNGRAHRG